jgi:hypothetical protein
MNGVPRRQLLLGGAALTCGAALGPLPIAAARGGHARAGGLAGTMHRWARDTWKSLVAMTDEKTGLTADNIEGPLANPVRSGYTSPTNIGGYLWSAVVARELGLISRSECSRRIGQTLHTLQRMSHHEPSGMFYNWYDERTAKPLTRWPTDGNPVAPFLSSVDNGWLAAALMVVERADRVNAGRAARILARMEFAAYYNPEVRPGLAAGLLRGGFWDERPAAPQQYVEGNHLGRGPNVFYTPNHYDTTVSETRIASYIAIARRQVPAAHYFATWRTFPEDCGWSWQEQRPVGETRRYLGIDVFEGAYTYRGMHIVPGWGGSMFEALMPAVFVPEESWAPRSWGVNHRLTVRAHREHGLEEAGYGYWGFSPASNPAGGYSEYGVDAIRLNPDGYPSDLERTPYDAGYAGCREGLHPSPTWGDGVVTPHASFLAMQYEQGHAYRNLVRIERELGAYGEGGFYDAVATRSGTIAKRYLSLDQAMIMGALGNVMADQVVRRAFVNSDVRRRIKPLIGQERFSSGLVG